MKKKKTKKIKDCVPTHYLYMDGIALLRDYIQTLIDLGSFKRSPDVMFEKLRVAIELDRSFRKVLSMIKCDHFKDLA